MKHLPFLRIKWFIIVIVILQQKKPQFFTLSGKKFQSFALLFQELVHLWHVRFLLARQSFVLSLQHVDFQRLRTPLSRQLLDFFVQSRCAALFKLRRKDEENYDQWQSHLFLYIFLKKENLEQWRSHLFLYIFFKKRKPLTVAIAFFLYNIFYIKMLLWIIFLRKKPRFFVIKLLAGRYSNPQPPGPVQWTLRREYVRVTFIW